MSPRLALVLFVLVGCGDAPTSPADAAEPSDAAPWQPPDLQAADAGAAPLALLADVNQARAPISASGYVEHAGKVYFGARGTDGYALFVTDGASAVLVAHRASWLGAPVPQLSLGGRLLFSVTDETFGSELWMSDGTDAGTSLLVDSSPGAASGFSRIVGVLGGAVLFGVSLPDGTHLWRSDATSANTGPIGDVRINLSGSIQSQSAVLGDKLLFSGWSTDHGAELWMTGGTAADTQLVADINPGTSNASPSAFVSLGDKVLFSADDGTHGIEWWVTDGSTEKTELLADINPGAASSLSTFSTRVLVHEGYAYFAANDGARGYELWRTDGTTANTGLFKEINPGPIGSAPSAFASLGDKLLFSATETATGSEPYITDGTAANTVLLKDINARTSPVGTSFVTQFVVIGSAAYFRADDGEHGFELWRTDGTAGGTQLVSDLWAGPQSGVSANPVLARGRLFFSGSDASGDGAYASDGTANGTLSLGAIGGAGTAPSSPASFVAVGSKVYFVATDAPHGRELWVVEGGSPPTLVLDITPGALDGLTVSTALVPFGDRIYFFANDGVHGPELWSSDGSADGTRMVKDIQPGAVGSTFDFGGTVHDGRIYFAADDGAHGQELWSSDGTEAGTSMVADLNAGGGAQLTDIGEYGGLLLFNGIDGAGTNGYGVFRVLDKGSIARVSPPGTLSSSYGAVGGKVFLSLGTPCCVGPTAAPGMYMTDGTAAGTVFLSGHRPSAWAQLGNKLAFTESGALYVTADGTNTTTSLVTQSGPSFRVPPIELGGTLYYLGGDAVAGFGLWRTDLTPTGTSLVRVLGVPFGAQLVSVGGRLWFSANDAPHGFELWSSDGTPDGTRLVLDVNPGPRSAAPSQLAVAASAAYLSLDDGVRGAEPWRLELP